VPRVETARDRVERCLDAVARREPEVHAFAWLDAERVRREAEARDCERTSARSGEGKLHGIPIAVKDIIDTAGIPTECGTPLFAGRVPSESAAVVVALERAGAIMFGKTVTAELAFAVPGPTRNPFDPERTPGGSSMGSAAAVACGMVPGALGTQTNSSTIMPATLCGVVGCKPTQGTIPTAGIMRFSQTLDQVGCFAQTVSDAAIIAAVLGAPVAEPDAAAPVALEDLALAVVPTVEWPSAAPAARAELRSAVAALERSGARIPTLAAPLRLGEARQVLRTIMAVEAARALGSAVFGQPGLVSEQLKRFLVEGGEVSEAGYDAALVRRREIIDEFNAWIAPYDALLTLGAPDEAPARTGSGDPRFCTPWTLVGAPALAIPSGVGPAGLPIGVQLVAGRGNDHALMEIGLSVEAVLAWRAAQPKAHG
jgi:Asp-tRNA(Asn)/Glu-tRNA(Gln) amidotransferase A subunit family amidase